MNIGGEWSGRREGFPHWGALSGVQYACCPLCHGFEPEGAKAWCPSALLGHRGGCPFVTEAALGKSEKATRGLGVAPEPNPEPAGIIIRGENDPRLEELVEMFLVRKRGLYDAVEADRQSQRKVEQAARNARAAGESRRVADERYRKSADALAHHLKDRP